MTESTPIRVAIVDDHTIVRSGLAFLINGFDEFVLVGEATNGEEAIALCDEFQPDVVLMDLIMPIMDGITATRTLRQTQPNIQILVLTSFEDGELVRAALEAGAIGYILKNASVDELADAIRAATKGQSTLSFQATQALVKSVKQTPKPQYSLTKRELQVLALLVDGLTNHQIALQLEISTNTINSHVSNIFPKLGVTSRTEAVSVALQKKIISPRS
jgi:two-component system, NarL family, response regulator LiaR